MSDEKLFVALLLRLLLALLNSNCVGRFVLSVVASNKDVVVSAAVLAANVTSCSRSISISECIIMDDKCAREECLIVVALLLMLLVLLLLTVL